MTPETFWEDPSLPRKGGSVLLRKGPKSRRKVLKLLPLFVHPILLTLCFIIHVNFSLDLPWCLHLVSPVLCLPYDFSSLISLKLFLK